MTVTSLRQMAIETRHLYKRFGEVTALEDINLRIARGEFVAIMGASGSGKTTLMNILTCLDTASEGQVILDGTDAAALDEEGRRRFRAQKIGLVFQQFHLIPFLTALENIMLAQHYHSEVDESAARAVLAQVGLEHRVTHLPSQLSGGEQRILECFIILRSPARFILLDEPFSQIAPLHVATLQTLIRQEKASKGILLTDHMYRHVTGIADRLYVMADGQAYPCENDEDLVRRGYLNHL